MQLRNEGGGGMKLFALYVIPSLILWGSSSAIGYRLGQIEAYKSFFHPAVSLPEVVPNQIICCTRKTSADCAFMINGIEP